MDFTGYKGLTCNYKGFSYYDVIKKFPHAGLMRTFQILKERVIYLQKNAKPQSTYFFPGSFIKEPLLTPLFTKRSLQNRLRVIDKFIDGSWDTGELFFVNARS